MHLVVDHRRVISGLAMAFLAAGCGSDDSGKSGKHQPPPANKSQPTPVAPVIETNLKGEDKIEGEKVILSFSTNIQNATYQCQVVTQSSKGNWQSCPAQGYVVQTPIGSKVTVKVKAVSPSGKMDRTPLSLNYVGRAPHQGGKNPVYPGPGQGGKDPIYPGQGGPKYPIPPVDRPQRPRDNWRTMRLDSLNLSSSWTFQVPNGMHILQYSGTQGLGGGTEVLQIMQGQDPNYFGMYPGAFHNGQNCSRFANQPVRIVSPAGRAYGYCVGKVQGERQIKKMFGFDYAQNHIEVGSDPQARYQKRMIVQVHKNYSRNKSILAALCHSGANASGYNEIFGRMPVMRDFWAYSSLVDKVKTCRVTLNGLNGGRYQVAGFVYTLRDHNRNDRCGQRPCTMGTQQALEVVFMLKNEGGMTRPSDYFAHDFQSLVYATLGRENPYVPFR